VTVSELVELLSYYDDDVEVAVAQQPSWPLAARVVNVTSSYELQDAREGADVDGDDNFPPEVIWVATEESVIADSPYAPREAWQ